MPKEVQRTFTMEEFVAFLQTLQPASESSQWGGRVFVHHPSITPNSSDQTNPEERYSFDMLLAIFQQLQNADAADPSLLNTCRLTLQELDCANWNDPHPYLTKIKAASHKMFTLLTGTYLDKEKLIHRPVIENSPIEDTKAASNAKTSGSMSKTATKIALSIPAFFVFLILSPTLLIPQIWTRALLPATGQKTPPISPNFEKATAQVAARRQDFDLMRPNAPTLEAMVIKTRGEPSNTISTSPVAVLFCQNANMMQSEEMLIRANQYNELGFNVVLFNYRGVGDSQGIAVQGQDLIDDGKAIVQAIKEGKIPHLAAATNENIVLDGTSIGGAVALAIGKENPDILVAANHTFSKWSAAAESFVTNRTNRILGIAAGWLAACSRRARSLDNTEALELRRGRRVTVIQTAGQDDILDEDSRLRPNEGHEGIEEEFFEDLTHGDMPSFKLNPNLILQRKEPLRQIMLAKLQAIMERQSDHWQTIIQLKVEHLNTLPVYKQIKYLPDLLETLRILHFAQNSKKCDLNPLKELLDDLAAKLGVYSGGHSNLEAVKEPANDWKNCSDLERCQSLVYDLNIEPDIKPADKGL